jgi:hypothetical protein
MVFSNSFTCRINLSLSFVSALGWLNLFLTVIFKRFNAAPIDETPQLKRAARSY